MLDFGQLHPSDTEAALKDFVMDVLLEFRISHCILGFTAGRASNMRVCFEEMKPCLRAGRIQNGCEEASKCCRIGMETGGRGVVGELATVSFPTRLVSLFEQCGCSFIFCWEHHTRSSVSYLY